MKRGNPDGTQWQRIVPALAALAGAAAYLPALRNGFAYDDVVIVATNARIHQWATLPDALRIAYWYTTGQLYRPLTTLAFGVEWVLSHGSPTAFHAVSALLHALVAALVARLALRLWTPAGASVAGLWFAVQPVHVGAVANVVGQSELLCAIALTTLALLASGPAEPTGRGRPDVVQRRGLHLLGIALLSAGALAAKETGIAAPVVVWSAAWLGFTRSEKRSAADQSAAWMRVAASVAGVTTMLALRVIVLGTLVGENPHPAFRVATGGRGMALALRELPRAIGLVLLPHAPMPDYSPTDQQLRHLNPLLIACGVGLVAVAILAVVRHAYRPSRWTFVAVWVAATLAPVSNLVIHTGVVVAERTLYSPSIGASLAVGASVAAIGMSTRTGCALPAAGRWMPRAALGLMTVMGLVGLIRVERAIPIWHDTNALIAAMRTRAPESYVGPALWARVLRQTGDYRAAHVSYAQAVSRFSGDASLLHDAGLNALTIGDTTTAIRWLTRGLHVDPEQLQIRTDLAKLYARDGQIAAARALLLTGLRIAPDQRSWRLLLSALPASSS